MKHLFWLLVLINAGLLVYFNLDLIFLGKPQAGQAEISPEKIQLLSQTQIDALPNKETTIPTTAGISLIESTFDIP